MLVQRTFRQSGFGFGPEFYFVIPGYSTSDIYDSSSWGTVMEWLHNHGQEVDIRTTLHGGEVFITESRGEPIDGETIGHALACAVLMVAEKSGEL
jgi:hypothetical protein